MSVNEYLNVNSYASVPTCIATGVIYKYMLFDAKAAKARSQYCSSGCWRCSHGSADCNLLRFHDMNLHAEMGTHQATHQALLA